MVLDSYPKNIFLPYDKTSGTLKSFVVDKSHIEGMFNEETERKLMESMGKGFKTLNKQKLRRKIDFRMHGIRHVYAIKGILDGLPKETIKAKIGWESDQSYWVSSIREKYKFFP